MAIVSFRTGKALSAREIKADTMRAMGLNPNSAEDTRTYQRAYDAFRNKVRNYETIVGRERGSLKVNELFNQQTKAQRRYGANYAPSGLLQGIQAAPSTSTGKVRRTTGAGGKPALQGVGARAQKAIAESVRRQFKGLTSTRKGAAEIAAKAGDNPQELYKGLTEYAERLQEARKNAYDAWRARNPRQKSSDFDWYSSEISANIE